MNRNGTINEGVHTEEDIFRYWLYSIEGIGRKTLRQLEHSFGTAKDIYHTPLRELSHFLNAAQQKMMRQARQESDPHAKYAALCRTGIRFIAAGDAAYPERLREIPDAPCGLYVRGQLPDDRQCAVAVVGARMCSEYGRYMARQFGMALALSGIQVISGMALGVDSIAQKAALDAGGASFAVLGSGADVCYPPENRALYDALIQNGGVLSEYAPGTQPKRQYFPPRNRIISGLADAVLVVEARAKSGTLITVDMALEQGRDVFVVPGRATDRLSDGCNLLLKQGAMLATDIADITEHLYGIGGQTISGRGLCGHAKHDASGESAACKEDRAASSPGTLEQMLLDTLDIHAKSVPEIEHALRERGEEISPQTLMCTLVEMALKGLIRQEGTHFYLPIHRSN